MSEEEQFNEDEELDLSTLPDDELVQQMHDDLYDGLKEEIEEGTNILLERGWGADKILNDARSKGCGSLASILETESFLSRKSFLQRTR